MSWSGAVTTRHTNAETEIGGLAVSPDSDAAEQVAQVAAAKAATIAIVQSGAVVSDDNQDVSVSLSGHANPADTTGTPTSGNASISVSVYQVYRATTDA